MPITFIFVFVAFFIGTVAAICLLAGQVSDHARRIVDLEFEAGQMIKMVPIDDKHAAIIAPKSLNYNQFKDVIEVLRGETNTDLISEGKPPADEPPRTH